MTKIEACKLLGISRSAGPAKAEQAYQEKQRQLQLKLVPGNPLADRQKAQAQLSRLTMAKQILQIKTTKQTSSKKPMPKKPRQRKSASAIPNQKPQTLTEAWETIVVMSPFPEPLIAVLLILIIILVLIGLLSSL